jgi:16S rRNA (cytosine1402-N4)-methyltransferase
MPGKTDARIFHLPVLLEPAVSHWIVGQEGTYADGTFGGGGHSRRALERLSARSIVYAFDHDPAARANVPDDPRLKFVARNFADMNQIGLPPLDGILLDLGVSSHQFDTPERGFSYRFDMPLDMRMNPTANVPTAAQRLNTLSPDELAEVFFRYGELKQSRKLARAVIENRPIETTFQLNAVVKPLLRAADVVGELSRVYQALRIAVNDEIESLKRFLRSAHGLLKPGGRLVVLSYHSLEDRLVKNFFRAGNETGIPEKDFYGKTRKFWRETTGKPIVASAEEIAQNPRARSAKMRVAEKLSHP